MVGGLSPRFCTPQAMKPLGPNAISSLWGLLKFLALRMALVPSLLATCIRVEKSVSEVHLPHLCALDECRASKASSGLNLCDWLERGQSRKVAWELRSDGSTIKEASQHLVSSGKI